MEKNVEDSFETDKQKIDQIFRKWEEYLNPYIPEPVAQSNQNPPVYKPTTKRITIEEYRQRQQKSRNRIVVDLPKQKKKKTRRSGKAFKKRKELAIVYRDLNLAVSKVDKLKFKTQINEIRKQYNGRIVL